MSRRRFVTLAVMAATAVAQIAVASEEAHHHEAGIPVATLIFSTINLLLFLWILARFVLPSVRTWVSERRTHVVTELEAAAAAKAGAQRLRAEWERRIAELDTTIAEMREQARRDSERERERILEAARKAAETIRRDAERAAAYELRRTQEQLRAELVTRAVQLAAAATRKQWSVDDQQRAVGEFLAQVRK